VTGKTLRALAVALTAVGAWQVGDGVWIYAKAGLGQHLLQRAWARTLAGETEVKPWPWADSWPVARLRVPAHGVDLIVLDGISGPTLARGRAKRVRSSSAVTATPTFASCRAWRRGTRSWWRRPTGLRRASPCARRW
jgi:hypothetical protein